MYICCYVLFVQGLVHVDAEAAAMVADVLRDAGLGQALCLFACLFV